MESHGGRKECRCVFGTAQAKRTGGATRRTGAWGGDSVFIKLVRLRQGIS